MLSREIEVFFNQFAEVYEDRDKYSISWAFEDAQGKLDGFREEVINNRLKKECSYCTNKKKFKNDFKLLQMSSLIELKKQKWYSRLFSCMYSILTFIEVILSVILVLVISKLSHTGEAIIHTKTFSYAIAITFAFMKVYIERQVLKPRIEELGWSIYLNSVEVVKSMTKKFNSKITDDLIELEEIKI